MAEPVTATVYFTITVRSTFEDGVWLTKAVETGVVTGGTTREEAEEASARGHILLIKSIKKHGQSALEDFMSERGIRFQLGTQPRWPEPMQLPNDGMGVMPVAA